MSINKSDFVGKTGINEYEKSDFVGYKYNCPAYVYKYIFLICAI